MEFSIVFSFNHVLRAFYKFIKSKSFDLSLLNQRNFTEIPCLPF